MGSDVLLQPSTLQADNHKKRTGFGPQQASFGVYVSNAFGGMSGALKLCRLSAPICLIRVRPGNRAYRLREYAFPPPLVGTALRRGDSEKLCACQMRESTQKW